MNAYTRVPIHFSENLKMKNENFSSSGNDVRMLCHSSAFRFQIYPGS